MTTENFMDYAKSFGYQIAFTGLGMGYLTIKDRAITETMDLPEVEKALALIGMAIMADTVRHMM